VRQRASDKEETPIRDHKNSSGVAGSASGLCERACVRVCVASAECSSTYSKLDFAEEERHHDQHRRECRDALHTHANTCHFPLRFSSIPVKEYCSPEIVWVKTGLR
jgi:hypothetical protein